MNVLTTLIYFIACHGGPADHFAEFAEDLRKDGHQVEILATGSALDKLRNAGAKEFNPEGLDIEDPISQQLIAERIAKSLGPASVAITDVGHILMARVQEAIAHVSPDIERLAYYENPESFVPGGYSKTTEQVLACADKVLFANANLAKEPLYSAPFCPIPLAFEKRIGIGYYPIGSANLLAGERASRRKIERQEFFEEHKIVDKGQKILVYLGGNNETYFAKALPAFLQILCESNLDPSQYIILVQHHPAAKNKTIDTNLLGGCPIFVSNKNSKETLILADAALYYQTSMGPQLILAGIPAIQVGHETYRDILVRNCLARSVTNKEDFVKAVTSFEKPPNRDKLLEDLGVCSDWALRLRSAIQSSNPS